MFVIDRVHCVICSELECALTHGSCSNVTEIVFYDRELIHPHDLVDILITLRS